MNFRLGTRGSRLALEQARRVAGQIRKLNPGLEVDLVVIKTSGDARSEFGDDIPAEIGEFSSALEKGLMQDEMDAAVHSAKDLPSRIHDSLVIGAYPERVDPRDAWVFRTGENVSTGGWVGTESPRRRLFWGERWPQAKFRNIRGNIDRRMDRCLGEKDWQGILLACAGIDRLGGPTKGLEIERLDVNWMVPAPGQGALAVQCRKEDHRTLELLRGLDNQKIRNCVSAEKSFLKTWGGGCSESLGAFSQIQPNGTLHLRAGVQDLFGRPQRASIEGPQDEADLLGVRLAEEMRRG
ncbi:MAG: hydroxymethylbilane synthase [Verrucomicrobia bacterium]|nr:hydroxymethylbilane synthase [Verrucomicrobiota bacterium]